MKKTKRGITKILKMLVIYLISPFIRRNDNYLAFGSWTGEFYHDNSRYLAEYISKEYIQYKIFWVGEKQIESRIKKETNYIFVEKIVLNQY